MVYFKNPLYLHTSIMVKSVKIDELDSMSSGKLKHVVSSSFGLKISNALCSNNITIEEFALAMSTTVNIVNKWLTSDFEFSPRLIDRIKEKLNISNLDQSEIFENAPICNLSVLREQLVVQSDAYHRIFVDILHKLD